MLKGGEKGRLLKVTRHTGSKLHSLPGEWGDFVLMHWGQEAPRTDCELLRKKREGSQGGLVSDISALLPWPGGPGRSLCLCC